MVTLLNDLTCFIKNKNSLRLELQYNYNPYTPGAYKGKFKIDKNLANRLKGRFLLQVHQGGAVWYVDQNGYRHNVRWNNLESLFRKLALGITDQDLGQIAIAEEN